MRVIYADNAATTKLDMDAFETMKPFLLDCYANASQPYGFSKRAKKAIKEARETIADCIGADPECIFFTSGGTESDNWAIKGSAFNDYDKRATIVSEIEHHAILNACSSIEKMCYPVVYIPPDSNGVIAPHSLEKVITPRTRLVSIMTANNEIGSIQPIKELAEITHKHGAVFHTDAVQAIGHISVDVRDMGIDMLSASAHKFNGPKGIGFLYCRDKNITQLHNGGSQEFGMRAGTENVPAIVGMAVALKKNIQSIEENSYHLNKLTDSFLGYLKSANVDFILNGHPENRLPGNINISLKGKSGEGIMHMLDLKGIYISTGSACDSVNQQVSHVIRSIGVHEEYAQGTIRITFGKENSEQDAIDIANSVIKMCKL